MKKIGFLFCFLTVLVVGWCQIPQKAMTEANSGGTFSMEVSDDSYFLQIIPETGADGINYNDGPYDRWITIDSGTCENETGMSIYFDQFDIDPSDTLFIYDGPIHLDAQGHIATYELLKCNNNLNPQIQTKIFPSPANTSGKLSLRFKTNGDGNSGKGFLIVAACREKCETVVPVIDSLFYKTVNGVIVDSGLARTVIQVDTNWNHDSTNYSLDTQWFKGMHLCIGQGIIFKAHGNYTNYYGYGPCDQLSLFEWNFGNGDDSSGIELTYVPATYRDLDCYDITLRITDNRGCKSAVMESVRLRISQNPIKTIYNLNTICTTDSLLVNIGYEGSNATITMQHLEFAKAKSRSVDCKTFIPDGKGQNCESADEDECFSAIITFDDFPAGRVVQSASDICSICINFEHSYLGDIGGRIICPTKQKAVLWYGTTNKDPMLPSSNADTLRIKYGIVPGMYNGGYQLIGIPYGGSSDGHGDLNCATGEGHNYCDSVCNMYGIGWDYCFSLNGNYTSVAGGPCDKTDPTSQDYFCNTNNDTNFSSSFITIPAPFAHAGQTAPDNSSDTRIPSKHGEGTGFDYYLPASDLSNLVGCPLNGDWAIQLCDDWPADNGWVFSWSLDFCGISAGSGCEYQVSIDSVLWTPDSSYGDFDLGHWRGLNIDNSNPLRSVISSHDTAGEFKINVKIYDEFGCKWDTSTFINSVWSPTPDLWDKDTMLICDVETVILDAKDRHTYQDTTGDDPYKYTFTWEPFGQTTDTIETSSMMGTSTLYTVEAQNNWRSTTCATRDSVRVNINHQPMPNFDPGVYPLEGCEPYTIHFENTSQYGDSYIWVFGDGDTSRAKSPTHTYGTGQYDFKYYVKNDFGCNDSLVYSKLITVYSSPVARFSWEPMNPTVMHPSVTFQNLTIPQSDDNRYYWEIQYDRDNNISYHTLRDVNPTFEWETDGEDITGNYIARLIAMTQNMGPSGNIVECRDTSESTILLVNDYLQFPNAVTPNGDGVNDKFIIRNLVNGLGYPSNSLAIYDRWGKRVFYKENIASEDDFWDPAASNVPAGTYFWRFTGKGYLGDIQRNGVVEVIY